MRAFSVSFLVAATMAIASVGCRTNADQSSVGVIHSTPKPVTWTLLLELEQPSVTAGETVQWGLVMVSSEGDAQTVQGDLTSDIEPNLWWSDTEIAPTVAGNQTLTATITADEWAAVTGSEPDGESALRAQATLQVEPAAVATVDLALDQRQAAAGQAIGFTVSAWDGYGNSIDASGALVTSDCPDVTVAWNGSTGSLTSTVPDTCTATASLGSSDETVTDSETFVIVPGPAASITLELSSTNLEVYETTHATVTVLDAYGNPTDDAWTLWVEGDGLTTLSYDNITFWEEGIYTVWAKVNDDETLTDSVGPITIDSTGPDLTIDEPERGSWSTDPSGTVSGTCTDAWTGVAELTVNGDPVSVAGDGSFSTEVDYDFGTNLIETVATDGDGNVTTDTRAVLDGSFLNYGAGDDGGLLARINEGPGGFDTIEQLGEDMVSATDLSALIPSPVYSNSSESCVDLGWFGKYCITWYSVNLYVTNPSIGSTTLNIDPTSAGTLDTTFTVYDPYLNWSASGKVLGVSYSSSGYIDADSITVDMSLYPYVSSGDIYVDVNSVNVSSSNFYFYMDSFLYDVITYFGVDVSGWVQGYMESAIENTVYNEVPSALEDALNGLQIGQTLTVSGVNYEFDAIPSSISVDDAGMTIAFATYFTPDTWKSAYAGLGSLYADYSEPSWASTPGMNLGLSADFLNQVFYAFWGGGLLDMTETNEDLGLDLSSLSTFFPTLTDLTLTTEALLPPVVLPAASGSSSAFELQLGDYHVTLYNGPVDPANTFIDLYVSLDADFDITASSSADSLSASLGSTTFYFDVVYPDQNSYGAAETEAFLDAIFPLLMPKFTDTLGDIPIPSLSGFSLSGVTVDVAGAEGGYLTLGGNLQAD